MCFLIFIFRDQTALKKDLAAIAQAIGENWELEAYLGVSKDTIERIQRKIKVPLLNRYSTCWLHGNKARKGMPHSNNCIYESLN